MATGGERGDTSDAVGAATPAAGGAGAAGGVWLLVRGGGRDAGHYTGRRQDDPQPWPRRLPRALYPGGAAILSQTSDMSQPTAPTCALGLTSADLSAWRDDALAPDETARIGAHRENCPACQQRLQGFEAIAATLQAQQVPAPDERLWQAVLAALAAERWTTSDDAITGEYHVPDEPDDG